jgi:RimJ/RimL family protein N-acetyltransferase
MPAHPAPITSTSCIASITEKLSNRQAAAAAEPAYNRRVGSPEIGDEVVVIRSWLETDIQQLVAALNDPLIERWLDNIPQPYSERDAREWLADVAEREESVFAIVGRDRGDIVGGVGLRVSSELQTGETGYWVRADVRGQGIATRALRLVARWAFESQGVERLQLYADVENLASQRVAEKAGFRRDGVVRAWRRHQRTGARRDFALYSLLPGEL